MDRQTDMKYQAPGDTSNPNANDVNDKQKEVKCTDLDLKQIGGFKDDFIKDSLLTLASNVLSKSDTQETMISLDLFKKHPFVFNTTLQGVDGRGGDPMPRTDQGYHTIQKLNLGEFQFSQSYLWFYDQMEKANVYLENMIKHKDKPLDSRLLQSLNCIPVVDGGDWDFVVNLLNKYGIIPHSLFPDTWSAKNHEHLHQVLVYRLREAGLVMRQAEAPHELKAGILKDVYNILAVELGVPPQANEEIKWEYNDKEGVARFWKGTPLEFYKEFVCQEELEVEDIFALGNYPELEYGKVYSIKRSSNMLGGKPSTYVKAPISALKEAVVSSIKANIPVPVFCNHTIDNSKKRGIMDVDLFNTDSSYKVKWGMNKKERMMTGCSTASHAMLITAVHVEEGMTVRYKVENSFGTEGMGNGGYFLMTQEFFEEHVYHVAVHRSMVSEEWVNVLDHGERDEVDWWFPE